MVKRLLFAVLVAAVAAGVGIAAQSKNTVSIPIGNASPNNGRQMYVSYCAPCHGVDGRGNGPVARSLRMRPTDLTQFSRDNHGKFPAEHIVAVLQSGANVPAHGTTEMPVWGPIFDTMSVSDPQTKAMRISNLSLYLKNLQAK